MKSPDPCNGASLRGNGNTEAMMDHLAVMKGGNKSEKGSKQDLGRTKIL
jgi:hypothetical protein